MDALLETMALVLAKKKRILVNTMSYDKKEIQHFILTRFNLLIFNKNKEGEKVRTIEWLEHRFELFEKYCLPSVKNQTCKNFEWIVLFDSSTPESFKCKVEEYQKICPQLIPVYVKPEHGRYYAQIFRNEIVKRLNARRLLTTYLDNDDALNITIIEDLQRRILDIEDQTFIYYDDGYQFFTDYKYMMRIHYPRNHFDSYVEVGNPATVKSVFGFGGHYYVYKIKGARIEHIKNVRMWCEVIHEKNVGNDAYFLGAKMVRDRDRMKNDFAVDVTVRYGPGIYFFKFLPRYARTFVVRVKHRLFGWEV